jgi:alpha-2-macroglobulin
MNRRNVFASIACYFVVALLVVAFAVIRVRTHNRYAVQSAPDTLDELATRTPPDPNAKPFFSLITNYTYSSTDKARIWVNYRGVDSLDFRVYRVKDPVKFFKGLDNRHQVGEDEQEEVGSAIKRKPTFLEKLGAFKRRMYVAVRTYIRGQLQNQSRKSFNQKFRPDSDDEEVERSPLNVADYARVPLLNPDQMVSSWREKLPPLEDVYDRRKISLGRREPGVYLIEAVNGDLRAFGVVLVSDLTLVQKSSNDGQLLIYAADRKTGAPRDAAQVQIVKGKDTVKDGKSDAHGLLRMKLEQPKAETADEENATEEDSTEESADTPADSSFVVMATSGENFAISDLDSFYFGEDGEGSNVTSYLYTDRPVYRPEQTVYFKGILRELTDRGYKLLPGSTVNVTVTDMNGGAIFEKELSISSRGTFNGELTLPEEAPLGSYSISAQLEGATATGYFEVQEYKKPEYKVTVAAPQKYVNAGDTAKFTVSAKYFFGAPVTRADVKYYIYRSPYYPWWEGDGDGVDQEFGEDPTSEEGDQSYGGYDDNMVQEGEGKLDAQGRLEVEFKVPQPTESDRWDYTYRLEAQVTDRSRRTMDGSASFVGVRGNTVATANPERYVYYQGDTARILVKAADHEGRPVQTRVTLKFVERRWQKVTKRTDYGDEYPGYEPKETALSSTAVDTNAQGEAYLDYSVPINGSIQIKTVVDENGRQIVSDAGSIWVADRNNAWSDYSYQDDASIKLILDKRSYKPGETAHILALLPTSEAHLLVTTELMTVMSVKQMDVPGRSVVIDLPIEAGFAPNIYLNVTYVRNGQLYTQEQLIPVPARDKLINLEIIPNKKEYRPRETASYTVFARNSDGSPVSGAEVSVGVVDESIYSIAPDNAADIRKEFYGTRYNSVSTSVSTNYYFTGYAGKKVINLAQNKRSYQLADFKNDGALANPLMRKIFKDTALWKPDVVTGADGKATVNVELPDNLTTWRATARAITSDTKVGVAVSKIVERKDVIIRMATPRFVTQGDTVTLSGIVHNYLKSEKPTQISLSVNGAQLLDRPQQTVTIPSQGEYRIDWRVSAPQTGDLQIVAKALTDTESDAMETSIPIVPRGLKQVRGETVTFADDELERSFNYNLSANTDPNSRTLRLEVTPSIAGTLFGALDYLTAYPYGCTEQTMSAFLPTVIVKQTLKNIETTSITDSNNIDRKVRVGLKRLYAYQHDDGGWGWWKDDPTDPYMSAYVVDGLSMAKKAGYEIEGARLDRGREKLKAMIDSGKTDDGKDIDSESRAYMIYALNESGWTDSRYINELYANRNSLQPYGRAMLALALEARGDEQRARSVAEEIGRSAIADEAEAHWASRYKSHGLDQSNDVEATALSLKALARITPASPLLPRAARWLVAKRKYGTFWQSTKETAIAIYGLTDYLKVSQELSPDYSLEVYLNGNQVLSQQMTASEASSGRSFVIQKRGGEVQNNNEVRIVKRGKGVLYLMNTMVTFTNDESVAPQSSQALRLNREYLRLNVVDGPDGQPTWKTEPLSGDIRSGDIIVSRLTVEGAPGRYLMIEDPIPAGCEQIENVSGIDLDYQEKDWSDWYSAREFRDNRTVLFVNYFDGKASFQYAMRVQVPGQFRIAPARVEQMYQPTVQANTANGTMTVLDK